MTKKSELKKALLAEVASRMRAFGYDGKVRGQSFRKRTPLGFWTFHLAFINHGSDFDITADVAIRYDDVERLVTSCRESLSEKLKLDMCTLGAELGNISEGVQRRWTIEDSTDVLTVAGNVVAAYETIGEPYLQRLGSLEAAFDALSRDDEEGWLHSPLHGARAESAVALAVVLGKHEELPALIARKEAFLQQRNDFGLRRFREFVTYLGQCDELKKR